MQIYSQGITEYNRQNLILAYDLDGTQLGLKESNINAFTKRPKVGDFILSRCKTQAFRVVRHAKATSCGQDVTVTFLSEPTLVLKENPYAESNVDKGVQVEVHLMRGCCHYIETYYLARPRGYELSARLL
ncbi:hypothetical protein F0M16_10995 [Vibrio cholerae]|uniref:Uncharacterized protein n=1 Tax=Vibrio cholerae TaxID=666 RepID=A0A5Q6PIX5_VIBCL|nr:hypothetical protein [Vibrio cholerae]KAA1254786.1 hypothetical protein F0M16_10995 [Vibrio cholerae]